MKYIFILSAMVTICGLQAMNHLANKSDKIKLAPEVYEAIQKFACQQLEIRHGKTFADIKPPLAQPARVKPAVITQPKPVVPQNVIVIPFAEKDKEEGEYETFTIKEAVIQFDEKIKSNTKQKSAIDVVKISSPDIRLPGYEGSIFESVNAETFNMFRGKNNALFIALKSKPEVTHPIKAVHVRTFLAGATQTVDIPARLEEFNKNAFLVSLAKPVEKIATVEHLLKDKTIGAKIKDKYGNSAVDEFRKNSGAIALRKLIKKYDPEVIELIEDKADPAKIKRLVAEIYDDLCYETRVIKR